MRPVSYTCRLARNHNRFVLDALARRGLIERRDGWALPTGLGEAVVIYWELEERGIL